MVINKIPVTFSKFNDFQIFKVLKLFPILLEIKFSIEENPI